MLKFGSRNFREQKSDETSLNRLIPMRQAKRSTTWNVFLLIVWNKKNLGTKHRRLGQEVLAPNLKKTRQREVSGHREGRQQHRSGLREERLQGHQPHRQHIVIRTG